MLNSKNIRELAYVAEIKSIDPIVGSDNCESASIDGWHVMVRKNTFKVGDKCVYFEIDSKLDTNEPMFEFLEKCKGKIRTQKYTFGGKGNFISQGLIMRLEECGLDYDKYKVGDFLTETLNVKYAEDEDNKRKASDRPQYKASFNKIKKNRIIKYFMRFGWFRKLIFVIFGVHKKKDSNKFPKEFPYVKVTDQERCENMPWVLEDKTPFIVTQKCDGSSATYILSKRKNIFKEKYEFIVCSRNIKLDNPKQKCYHDKNYYWECAEKYDIENKLKDYLLKNPDLNYVCWQGEICAPSIQGNPHKLKETHLYLFHMIDSKIGKYDIRDAFKIWKEYNMETVPICSENYILPNEFEEFKQTADGYYNPIVCESQDNCPREGFVYYKTTDPNFSFKNVSREYLLKR